MKSLLACLLLLLGHSAALACSCVAPDDVPLAERRAEARRIAVGASFVGEVVVESGIDERRARGEVLRPIKRYLGAGRPRFQIERRFGPGGPAGRLLDMSDSCDVEFGAGTRTAMILFSANRRWQEDEAVARLLDAGERGRAIAAIRAIHARRPTLYHSVSLCSALMLRPENIALILEEARKLGRVAALTAR